MYTQHTCTFIYSILQKLYILTCIETCKDISNLNNLKITVNRDDFQQIFTIFINIFLMMNLITGFIWGLVRIQKEQHIYTQL